MKVVNVIRVLFYGGLFGLAISQTTDRIILFRSIALVFVTMGIIEFLIVGAKTKWWGKG